MKISISRTSTEQLVKEGKVAKIELYATTGDGFAERLEKFLKGVESMASVGTSRTLGVIEGDRVDGDYKDMKCFVDGDGSDKVYDVKIVT